MNSKIKIVLIILGAVLLLSGGFGTYYFYNKTNKYNSEKENIEKEKTELEKSITEKQKALDALKADQSSAKEESKSIIEESSSEVSTSNWKTYTNPKYGYSFKYPGSFTLGPCNSKPCANFLDEQQGGDIVIMQGDVSTNGWPSTQVIHYDTEAYNPPAGSNLNEWVLAQFPWMTDYFPSSANITIPKKLGGSITGADFVIPQSPQSYATRYIFYIEGNKLFQITMSDPESVDAKAFYDAWIATYNED